jgi:hypothetical protein
VTLNPSTERILDGKSWAEFCDMLKMAGNVITGQSSPEDPLDRAEGFRYLGRLTRAALEAFIEHADPLAPVLHRPVHETVKMGADNPDNYYQNAEISGKHEYRIWGQRGTIHYLGLGTYAGKYGLEGRTAQTGYLEGSELFVEPDGSLEIWVSCKKPEGNARNWLRMEPDTSSLIVRQTFLDRRSEAIADLHIERLGGKELHAPLSPEKMDQGLGVCGRFVVGCAAMFTNWADGFAKRPNELPLFNQDAALAAHGDPNICYYHGYWKLEPDQALVIEVTPPECDYWNFQLNNHWMESLDYRYHSIAVNKKSAKYRDDASVRIVVAHHRLPGMENWIDTAGHRRGTMCWRWVRAKEHPQPRTRTVALADL